MITTCRVQQEATDESDGRERRTYGQRRLNENTNYRKGLGEDSTVDRDDWIGEVGRTRNNAPVPIGRKAGSEGGAVGDPPRRRREEN